MLDYKQNVTTEETFCKTGKVNSKLQRWLQDVGAVAGTGYLHRGSGINLRKKYLLKEVKLEERLVYAL